MLTLLVVACLRDGEQPTDSTGPRDSASMNDSGSSPMPWWQPPGPGQVMDPGGGGPSRWLDVQVGSGHACARNEDRTLSCWGSDEWYEVIPTDLPVNGYSMMGATCGVIDDGTARCWYRGEATSIAEENGIAQVEVGAAQCWLDGEGQPDCRYWPSPPAQEYGVVDDVPTVALTSLAVGAYTACGVSPEATIECWGNTWLAETAPTTGHYASVSVAGCAACALTTDGEAVCWGDGVPDGHDGCSGLDEWTYPATVSPDERFSQLDMGGGPAACGLRLDGGAECWGTDFNTGIYDEPPAGVTFTQISVGTGRAACGVTVNGHVKCWGAEWPYEQHGLADGPE